VATYKSRLELDTELVDGFSKLVVENPNISRKDFGGAMSADPLNSNCLQKNFHFTRKYACCSREGCVSMNHL